MSEDELAGYEEFDDFDEFEDFDSNGDFFQSLFFEIHDEQDAIEIDPLKIRKVCEAILDDAGVTIGRFGVAIVDNETIHQLNNEFLEHDYPTDVLSFTVEEDQETGLLEGEVIVSAEMAKNRAAEFSWLPEDELLLYIVHGTLHLVGYDDLDADSTKVMREKEQQYMRLLDIEVPSHELEPPIFPDAENADEN